MQRKSTRSLRRRQFGLLRHLRLESLEDRRLLAVLSVPGDHLSLQTAVNNAQPGDEIQITAAAVLNESVDLNQMGSALGPANPGDLTIRATNPGTVTLNGGAGGALGGSSFTGDITLIGMIFDQDAGNTGGVLDFSDITGTIRVLDSTFASGFGGEAVVLEVSGAIESALVLSGNDFQSQADNEDFVSVVVEDNPQVHVVVEGNTYSGGQDDGVNINVQSPSGPGGPTITARISDNQFMPAAASGSAIQIDLGDATSDGTTASITIDGNTIDGADGDAIVVDVEGTGTTALVTVKDNMITSPDGEGIFIDGGSVTIGAVANVLVDGNTISGSGDSAIRVRPFGAAGAASTWNVAVRNNTISDPGVDGIEIDADGSDDNYTLNIELLNNSVGGTIGAAAYRLAQGNGSTVNLDQGASASTDPATVVTDNGNTGTPVTISGTVNVVANAVDDANLPALLGDFVWDDQNSNGIQDPGEPGLAGVRIDLAGDATGTTFSDPQGKYLFSVLPGSYTLTAQPPAGLVFAPQGQGGDPTLDSDFDVSTGEASATVTAGANNLDIDAGFSPPPDTTISIVGTTLRIEDSGTASDDTLTIQSDTNTSEFVISDPNNLLEFGAVRGNSIRVPFGTIAAIEVATLAGDDTLTVDFSAGNFSVPLDYDGGTQISSDELVLSGGGTFASATYGFIDASSGTIDVAGNATITYTGLEPVTSSITATDVTLNYSETAETLTVTDAGGGQTTVTSSVAAEMLTFSNPTGTLTINAGDIGDDVINISSLAANYPAEITLDGQGGNDTVNLNAAGGLSLTAALDITAETITQTQPISGIGSVRLTTSTASFDQGNSYSGGTVVSQGTLELSNSNALGTGPVTLGDAGSGSAAIRLIATHGGGDLVINEPITVSASGTGTVTIGGEHTGGRAFFDGLVTLNRDVTLRGAGNDRTQFRGGITGTGNVIIDGGGRVTWSTTTATTEAGDGAAPYDFNGSVTITGSSLLQTNSNFTSGLSSLASRDFTIDGGSTLRLAYDTDVTMDELSGSGNVEALAASGFPDPSILTVGADNGSSTFNGRLLDSGRVLALTKTGSGTITLAGGNGNNTATGLTLVEEGVLQVGGGFGGDGAIRGDITVESGATYRMLQDNIIINSSLVTLNGTGTLDRNGRSDVVGALTGDGTVMGNGNLTLDLVSGQTPTFSGTVMGGGALGVRGHNDNGTNATQILTGTTSGLGTLFVDRGNSSNDVPLLELAGAGTTTTIFVAVGRQGSAQGMATLEISGTHTLNTGNFFLGESASDAGFVNQTGGAVSVSGHMRVGHWPNETSIYTLDAGTITITGTPAGGLEQNGGVYLGIDGTGILNHNDGTLSTRFLWLDNRGATAGTDQYNLTGGVLVLTGSIGIGSSNPGSMEINLGGGTIRTDVDSQMTAPGILTGTNGDTTFDTNGNRFNVSGALSGNGGLLKSGDGTMTLAAANTYTGGTVINGGVLLVNGSTAAGSPITVNPNGTLGGNGNAAGPVTLSGGTIAPGASPGILQTGSVDASGGGTLAIEIEGDDAGVGAGFHDQLAVTGSVELGAGTTDLVLSGSYVPQAGDDFVLIANDGAEDTTGFFSGLPEGSELTFNGQTLYITYNGGDGNDVVLNTGPVVSGTSGSDILEVTPLAGGDLQYQFLPGGPLVTLTAPASFTFNGRGGDDVMIVQANGQSFVPLTFNGGDQDFSNPPTPSNGDALQVFGSGQDALYTPSATTTGDGEVTVAGGGTITFTGLEPVDMSGFGTVTFSPAGLDDVLAVDNGFDSVTGTVPALVVSGTTGGVPVETLHAWNNTTLAIDTSASDGDDSVTVNSADNAHANQNLSIDTGAAGTDSTTFAGPTVVTGTVEVDSGQINVNATVTAGVQVDLNAGSDITTSGPAVDIAAPSLLAVASGGINLDTSVDDIDATSGGAITLDETDIVTLTNVTSNNNPIAITAGGTVTAENVDAGSSTVSISVTNGGLVSGPGDAGTADIVAATMNLVLVTAGNNLGASPADRLEIDADLLDIDTDTAAQNNAYLVDTAGGLQVNDSTVGGIPGATFDLLVLDGSLTSVSGGPRDIGADIIVLEVTGAASTMGTATATPLEINALTSTTALSAGGDIFLRDTSGDFPAALIDANGGNVDLDVTNGDLLSVAGDAGVPDVVGNVVVLRLSAGNTIGVDAADRLELDANVLQVRAINSSAFLLDTAAGVALRDSSVGPGSNTYDLLAINGGIVSETVDGTRDVGAGILILETTGLGSIGVSTLVPLEINATDRFDAATEDENIFVFDPTDPLPVGLVDAGAGNVDLRATGAITDANGASSNIIATGASLRATAGIGSGDALETSLSTLAADNVGPGAIEVVNSVGGLLTIGTVNGFSGIGNTGGAVSVTNLGALTVAADVTAAGPIVLTASDSPAPGDDLTVNPGVTVQSTGSGVTLNAGDDALIDGDLAAATTVTVNSDFGNADPGTGGTVTINGVVTTTGGAFVNGEADDDVFNLAMQTTTSFTIDGMAPSFGMGVPPATGDTLNLAIPGGATDPTLTVDGATPGSGVFTTSSAEQPVDFTDIEQFDTSDPFHLVVDRGAVGVSGDVIDAQINGGDLEIRVNGTLVSSSPQADILSLTLLGSNNDETFSITETAEGLPSFLTTPPSFVPGSNGGHLNPTATLRLGAALGAPPALTDVTLHIDGGSGDTDDLLVTLISGHDVLYASDMLDAANSGNVGIVSPPLAGPPQALDLLLSFANLEPLTFVGAGGGLLLDASSTPATSTLTISDAGAANDGVSVVTGDGGFEDTTFSGFNVLAVVGGPESETITLAGADPAASNGAALSLILIDADEALGTDTADDIINVQSLPGSVSAQLLGGAGNDQFNLFDGGSTVDNIAGPITLDGEAGEDVLTVIDSGDVTGDTVLITETTIEGMTSFTGAPDVVYTGIEQLDVTTSSGEDDVTVDMTTGGSDLVDAVISAAAGDDLLRLESFVTDLATITLNGNAGSDTFNEPTGPADPNPNTNPRGKLEPSLTTEIFVNGEAGPAGAGNPTSPPDGDMDTFNLDVTVLEAPVIVDTIAGIATSAGPHQNVNFSGMEELCLDDETRDDVNINIGELYVRTTDFRERIIYTLWNDGGLKLRIDDLENGIYNTFPEHFGLAGGVQMLERIVTFARGGDDIVSVAGHVRDGNDEPIPVEFHGEDGDDYLAGGLADDILVGGPGSDRVLGGEGNNMLYGDGNVPDANGIPVENPQTDGDDNVSGRSGNDVIFGGGGNDRLNGSSGDDYLHAGSGDDLADGGLGDDVVIGADGDDTLSGNDGDDILLGGFGLDELLGRSGNDVLLGGEDIDRVRGDAGNDLVVGGTSSAVDSTTSEAALRAVLAEWVSGAPAVPAGLGTLQLDGVEDLLIGDLGADAFHQELEDRIYDFRLSDGDSMLP